jgi:hypothetical protein
MNAKNVLSKILTILSAESEEVLFTDAQTRDGAILQSPTFDVGEMVEVVSEDGTKTPAPDGEHEISLRDSEGNEVIIKIETKDGVITERENVELEKKMEEEVVDKDAEEKDEEDVEMADATMEEAKGLPNTTEEPKANEVTAGEPSKDPLIALAYRIEEMEKAMEEMKVKMGEMSPVSEEAVEEESPMPEGEEVAMAEEEEEEELPKLDGAPIDATKLSSEIMKPNFGKKVGNSQSSFLSKLYR